MVFDEQHWLYTKSCFNDLQTNQIIRFFSTNRSRNSLRQLIISLISSTHLLLPSAVVLFLCTYLCKDFNSSVDSLEGFLAGLCFVSYICNVTQMMRDQNVGKCATILKKENAMFLLLLLRLQYRRQGIQWNTYRHKCDRTFPKVNVTCAEIFRIHL